MSSRFHIAKGLPPVKDPFGSPESGKKPFRFPESVTKNLTFYLVLPDGTRIAVPPNNVEFRHIPFSTYHETELHCTVRFPGSINWVEACRGVGCSGLSGCTGPGPTGAKCPLDRFGTKGIDSRVKGAIGIQGINLGGVVVRGSSKSPPPCLPDCTGPGDYGCPLYGGSGATGLHWECSREDRLD